jgi:hypothetical protein
LSNVVGWNLADTYGGGIECIQSAPVIMNNILVGNAAGLSGGGIGCFNAQPAVANNLIVGNKAAAGGGIGGGQSSAHVSNSTIVANSAGKGGGLYLHYTSSPSVTDTIFFGNTAAQGKEVCLASASIMTISYSDVDGGKGSIQLDPDCQLNWGSGMIDQDPLFVQGPSGFHYLGQVAAGQPADSPCVDSGSDLAANLGMDVYWTRTDGVADSGIVDMGFHHGPFTYPALQANAFTILEGAGGAADFLLLAGQANANRNYILLGGVNGTKPGTALPGGKAVLPLNWDLFTNLTVLFGNSPVFQDFLGVTDQDGAGAARLVIGPLPPGSAGVTMHFAFALNAPWNYASNPVGIEVVP